MDAFTSLLGQPDDQVPDPLVTPATQPQQPRTAFDRLLEGPTEQDFRLGANLNGAAATTPDGHQKAVDVGKTIGAPADSVASNMPEAERQAKVKRYHEALNDAPALARLLAEDPDIAKLAADDLPVLAKTESTLSKIFSSFYGGGQGTADSLSDLGQSGVVGMVDMFGSGAGGIAELNDVLARTAARGYRGLGLDTLAEIADPATRPWWLRPQGVLEVAGDELKDVAKTIDIPEERQNLGTDIAKGVGQVAGQIALAFLTGGSATTAMLAGQGADIMSDRVEDAGKEGTAAGDVAIVGGAAVTAVLEKLGLDALLHRVPPAVKNGILRQLTDISLAGGIEALEEVAEGILHNMIEMVTVNPDATVLDWEGMKQEAAAGGGTGAVIRALVNAATKGRQISANTKKEMRAGQDAATVEALVTGTAESKLRDRNPDAFSRVMAAQTQGTPVETFYIPADRIAELYQDGAGTFDDDPLNQIEGLREQLAEALAVGGDVEISAADYLTHIAPTDTHGKLKNDLRASRDGWSVNDAKAYSDNPDREADLQALVEELAIKDENAAVGQTVFDDVYKQLMDTGKYESRQAAAQATLVRERYLTRAERLGNGADADALYLRDQLKVHGPGALARVQRGDLDLVIARLKSGETVTADKTPVLDIVRKAGGVKPGSNLAGELKAMGITSRTHPGLFRKTGIGDVDNFVLSEHDVLRDNGVPDSGNGYADRVAVLEALRREAGGRGAALLTQDERSQAARLDEPVSVLAEQMEAAGLDPNTMTADEIKAWATGQRAEAEPADTQGVLLQADALRDQAHAEIANLARRVGGFSMDDETAAMDEGGDLVEQTIKEKLPELAAVYRKLVYTNDPLTAEELPPATRAQWEASKPSPAPPKAEAKAKPERKGATPFKAWFGKSKIVDAKGEPLVLHHGSPVQDIEAFRNGRTAYGIFFTDSLRSAAYYNPAADLADPKAADVYNVYLRAEKPADLRKPSVLSRVAKEAGVKADLEEIRTRLEVGDLYAMDGGRTQDKLVKTAEAMGFDAVIMPDTSSGDLANSYIVFEPTQIKSVNNRGTFDANDPRILFQSVYHGSPHIFDAFTTAAIGSGEGAQIFGFGLYFAARKEIAKWYREKLTPPGKVTRNGAALKLSDAKAAADDLEMPRAIGVAGTMLNRLGKSKSFDDYLSQLDEILADPHLDVFPSAAADARNEKRLAEHLDAEHLITVTPSKAGRLYTVEIPDDGEYLLHDEPIFDQPEAVKKQLGALRAAFDETALEEFEDEYNEPFEGWTGAQLYKALTLYAAESPLPGQDDTTGNYQRDASEFLLSLGVRGIKYLDASARGTSGDSFNYVVFADSDAVIQAYEQSAAGGARGSYQRAFDPYGNPANIIKLTQSADLSTALHEFGHFYLFQLIDDAAGPGATDEARGKLQADLQTILDHVGVKVDAATATPDQIHAAMTRDAHELWARSFEVYLREGKSPSASLRDAFASFSAWLVRIYKTLKAIPDYRKNLTPEVRGVMDRLLATDEAIKDAQASSSFRVPSALRTVMTAAEQKSLERLTEQANREATEDLRKRVMREMERERLEWWKEEREKVRKEIEAEVQNRPVYRAYNIIRTGQTADGGQLVDENGEPRAMKLDRKTLELDYGKDVIKLLPKGLSAKDGASHHVVANLTGFGSADELRDALMNFQPMKDVVEAETDAAMKARHGDMLSDGRLAEDAAELVLNEKQLELAALQAKALRRLASSVVKEAAGRLASEQGVQSRADDAAAVGEAQRDVEAVANAGAPAEAVAGLQVEQVFTEAFQGEAVGVRRGQQAALRQVRGIQTGLDLKAIQAAAKRAIAGKRIEDAQPGKYRAQADRLVRKIEEAIAKRDYENASTLKEKQLINLALAREAQEAQARVEKAVKRFSRLRKPDSKLAGSTDVDSLGAARAILSVFGLSSPQVGFDQQVWFQKMAEQDPVGAADMRAMIDAVTKGVGTVAARGRTRTRAKHRPGSPGPRGGAPVAMGQIWRQMTVEEFRSLTDAVDAILSMGRDERSVELEGERLEIKAAVAELIAQASGRDSGKRIGETEAVTDAEKRTRSFWGLAAFLERTESWARRMDDGKVGPFTKYLVRPVLSAVYEYRAEKTRRIKQLVDILEPRKQELLGKPIHSNELNYTFANKGALLHAILHSGNDSNFRKLLLGGRGKGFAWGKAMPDGSVDRSRWDSMIRRFVQEGVLTKADFDTAQQIWDLLEELKGPAQIAHRAMKGFYFNEVEVTGIDTPFGKFRGGYVPAVSDRMLNPDAGARVDANAMGDMANAGILPSVAKGFTRSRVEYNQPLELNISRLTGHMDTVLKFTYLGPVVRNVTRLAINREFRQEMFGIDAHAIDEVLIPWLQRVARQTVEIPPTSDGARTAAKFFKGLQKHTGIAAMAGNLINALQQITGISVAMVRVKPHRVLRGLVSSTFAPRHSSQMIMQKSAYMRDRMDSTSVELMTTLDDLLEAKSVFRKIRDKTDKHGYFAQIRMQNLVDKAVWLGSYEQGIAAGKTEDEAVLEADSVVRTTQSSFAPEDVSRVEAQQAFIRPFLQFYSYFDAQYNVLRTEFDATVTDLGWVRGSPRLFYIYVVGALIPSVLATAMMEAARGELGDDDDDGLLDDIGELFALSQIKYFAAMAPGVGTLVNFGINLANDKPYDDRLTPAPVIGQVQRVGSSVVNLATGNEPTAGRAVADALLLISMAFGLPLAQAGKPLGYIADVATGEQEGDDVFDWARGLLSGREGPKQ